MQSLVFLIYFFISSRRKTFGGPALGTGRVNPKKVSLKRLNTLKKTSDLVNSVKSVCP